MARRASEMDGRGRIDALTARGRETIDVVFAHRMDNKRRLLATLTMRETTQLETLLAMLPGAFEHRPGLGQPVH